MYVHTILANFIILNMFIAVIQENFDVTEGDRIKFPIIPAECIT